jgi:hypothetical protein
MFSEISVMPLGAGRLDLQVFQLFGKQPGLFCSVGNGESSREILFVDRMGFRAKRSDPEIYGFAQMRVTKLLRLPDKDIGQS